MIMENIRRNYTPLCSKKTYIVSYKNIAIEKILGFQVSMLVTIILATISKQNTI
jgi:hypothetical protein